MLEAVPVRLVIGMDSAMLCSVIDESMKKRKRLQLGLFSESDMQRMTCDEAHVCSWHGMSDADRIKRLPMEPRLLLRIERRLLLMERLQTLVVGQFEETLDTVSGVRSRRTMTRFLLIKLLVSKCAANLLTLALYDHYLVPENVSFPKLTSIRCGRLPASVVRHAPRLMHVHVSDISLHAIRALPPSLATFADQGTWTDARSLAIAMSHMVSLKSVSLRISGAAAGIDRLLSPLHLLQCIDLTLDLKGDPLIDPLIDAVTSENPGVKVLKVAKVRVTDDCLRHMQRLSRLQHLDMSCSGRGF